MKKIVFVTLFVLAIIMLLGIASFASETEITISYANTQDPTGISAALDTNAYSGGKQVVKAGESFTLPTTSSASHTGEAGYQLIWYTENGRTYKGGEVVSFNADTRLYRCVAKEAATSEELSSAMQGDTRAAILTADIERTSYLQLYEQSNNIIVLNGHTLTINGNVNGMGDKRTGKHLIGQGKFVVNNPNGNKGTYGLFNCESHGWYNDTNKCVIGVDVTVDAPNYFLFYDGNGSNWDGLPWFRIYGKLNIWSFGNLWSSNGKTPTIEVFEGAELTVNGTKLMSDSINSKHNSAALRFYIYGGTINLPKEAESVGFWTNDIYDEKIHTIGLNALSTKNADTILITGGTFNVKLPDAVLRADGYEFCYDEASGIYSVEPVACTGGGHNYVLAEAYGNAKSTCTTAGVYYYRCECGAYKTGVVNELGHSYTIITIEKEATVSEFGTKRATCDRCEDSYTYTYAFSPLEVELTITVNTENGLLEKTLLAKDVFEMEITDTAEKYLCVIKGVKGFEGYTKSDIVKLQLPSGIITVADSAISEMPLLLEIYVLDNSNYTFETSSIKKCPVLEKMSVGNNNVFKNRTVNSCPAFATLDITRGSATFEASSFLGNSAIKELKMAAGNTYNFGTNSFDSTGLTSVIFPDDSNIVFSGAAAFYAAPNLTYVYFGKNCISDKKINNKPFDCCYSLKTVVLMDIVYINEYTFCCNGNANSTATCREGKGLNPGPLVVYSHNPSITFSDNTFANRTVLGVEFYTASSATALKNCAYTVYAGLPHAYSYDVITESTCVTQGKASYVTSCPCGEDYRTNTYVTYSTLNPEINGVENQPLGTDIVDLPLSSEHTDSEIVKDVVYKNGMTQAGTRVYKCLYCDEAVGEESEPTFAAIFKYYGYSVSTFGTLSVSQCYGIDRVAYADYAELTGRDVSYGVAAALKVNAPDGVLVDADGTALNQKIIAHSCVGAKYDVVDIKITGLDSYVDTELYFCGYYVVNGEVYYIDNGKSDLVSAEATTYNKILELCA